MDARSNLDEEKVIERIKPKTLERVPLDEYEMSVLRTGLELVVMGAEGTAAVRSRASRSSPFPVAGKTGTAQIGETPDNRAWFVSYAPADNRSTSSRFTSSTRARRRERGPRGRAEIYEGIFNLDADTGDVTLGPDASG